MGAVAGCAVQRSTCRGGRRTDAGAAGNNGRHFSLLKSDRTHFRIHEKWRLSGGGYLVACIVHHREGHSERTEFLVPIDVQARMNDAQKAGSALTYGRRYALCAALGIVTAEEDDDGRATEAISSHSQEPSGSNRVGNSYPPAGSPVTSPPPTQVAGHPSGSAPPVRPNGASHSAAVPSVPEAKGGLQLPTPPAGEPIQWISPAQHRRLEALLKDAGLPRERVRDWLANRHPGAYPEGVRLNRIWVRHAEEIERRIPQFVAALAEEERRAREQQAAALTEEREALAWVRTEYGWQGDLEELEGLAVDLAAQAEGANRRAQARDGALDARELEQARLLAERAGKLKAALRAARRAAGEPGRVAA